MASDFKIPGAQSYSGVVLDRELARYLANEITVEEALANIAEFGPGIYGAGAASQYFFNVTPKRMSDRQAALLAAVLPNPRKFRADEPTDYVRKRSDWIVRQMWRLRREAWITRITT